MTDVDPWQEQERRAAEILPILEQTLVIAQNQNLLEQMNQGWCYEGNEHALIYDPESEQLSIAANDHSWQLNWHEGLFVRSAETHITDEHLTEFRELAKWLEMLDDDRSHESQTELSEPQAETLLSNAAGLFEYYASQGDTAFKFSPNSTEHFYRVLIDNEVYLISRDDEIGVYSLQRENGDPLSVTDSESWKQMESWLQHLAEQPSMQAPHAAAPYWEQQTIQANALLLDAQALFTFHQQMGTIEYDPVRKSHTATIENYTIGYSPQSDVFWLERNDERLASATHYQQHRNSSQSHWHLNELHDLGNISHEDVRRLREWRSWLMVQSNLDQNQAQQPTPDVSHEQLSSSSERRSDYDLDR
ncbi:MAG: hypothetical protein KME10_03900 [Plectolyngbya sp. WJT66-NPBG17]|jgi:quinol monooxygenase YgiN|nr:hypothetical protein [Plectolyngbya sp. WJT66-NPBG17]MBW4528082.1 hypothetical protein [Phormidium tanganyikae FI6-MK23]